MNPAPIVLLVYNRPEHTSQTLHALMSNDLSNESKLFIFSDGPKENAELKTRENIAEVRKLIRQKQWCKEVTIYESEYNKGLADSVRSSVSDIIHKFGRIIVLEDDLVISPVFLTYMNAALNYYETRKSVFSVSGYCLPPGKLKIPYDYRYDVFVSLRTSSWGWGTWADRWEQIDWETRNYIKIQEDPNIKEAFSRGGDDIFPMLKDFKSGKLDIWTIQWVLAHFENHAVAILPTRSYVDNIGLDGSGIHCGPNQTLRNNKLSIKNKIRFIDIIYEDKRIINRFYNVYCSNKRSYYKKIINNFMKVIGLNNLIILKGKVYY